MTICHSNRLANTLILPLKKDLNVVVISCNFEAGFLLCDDGWSSFLDDNRYPGGFRHSAQPENHSILKICHRKLLHTVRYIVWLTNIYVHILYIYILTYVYKHIYVEVSATRGTTALVYCLINSSLYTDTVHRWWSTPNWLDGHQGCSQLSTYIYF